MFSENMGNFKMSQLLYFLHFHGYVIDCEGLTSCPHPTEHSYKDWSRSVFRKYGKFQKFITSLGLFLIRFSMIYVPFCTESFFPSFLKINDETFGPDFAL